MGLEFRNDLLSAKKQHTESNKINRNVTFTVMQKAIKIIIYIYLYLIVQI